MDYVEILSESRGFDVGLTSLEQTIVIQFKLEEPTSTTTSTTPDPYVFLGEKDDVEALQYAYSLLPEGRWAPSPFGEPTFLILSNLRVSQVDNYGWWKAEARYVFDQNTGQGGSPVDPDDETAIALPFIRIGFAVGNVTRKITQSRIIISRDESDEGVVRPLPCVDVIGNAIGVTEDGVEGAEIYGNGLVLQITVYYFPSAFTFSFLNTMAVKIPGVNNAEFLGYSRGEVLIIGADGQAVVGDVVPVTYTMEVKKNLVARFDAPFPSLTCEGHHLIDYGYVKTLDACAELPLSLPSFRTVHQVYGYSNFALLGFPPSTLPTTTT